MITKPLIQRVSLILILTVGLTGCSQPQEGTATETGITPTEDTTSQPATTSTWEYVSPELSEYPGSWVFLIKDVKVTRKSILSARFTIRNVTDKVIFSDRYSLERFAACGLRLWRRDTPGSFWCVRFDHVCIYRNPMSEHTRIQPGEEISLDYRFIDSQWTSHQFVHEPEGGIRDWKNVPPVVLEPGEYVVDSQLLLDFSTEEDIFKERKVNLASGNKIWVEVK